MSTPILHIKHLKKSFEGLTLFEDVNLQIHPESINVLLGANGSGKTTLFNMICGYIRPNNGHIYLEGYNITQLKPYKIAQRGIGKMWQAPQVFPNHTIRQNLITSAKEVAGENIFNYLFQWHKIKSDQALITEEVERILGETQLIKNADQLVGNVSLGERKMLSLAMLLMNQAKLLVLDEPFSNVNPSMIERISKLIQTAKKEGKTILMIEHKISFAEKIADELFRIEHHKIVK